MAGIYIHIPFCKTKCHYCDFYKSTLITQKDEVLAFLKKEFLLRKDYLGDEKITTIYFGGGTPSLLSVEQINEFLQLIQAHYLIDDDAEVTIEANPEDLNYEYCLGLRSIGINRLSVGIQSFNDDDLALMNRRHRSEKAKTAITDARKAGFDNISIDLIYGLPKMTNDKWSQNLEEAFKLKPEHISAYHLTYHKGTVFNTFLKKGKIAPIPEDDSFTQFEMLIDKACEHGYEQYEISNFSLDGFHSRHNSSYWKGVKYLGIGPSAHSFDGNSRQWNVASNKKYMLALENGDNWFEKEELSEDDKLNDYIITRLRTIWGLDLNEIKNRFNEEALFHVEKMAQKYIQSEHIIQRENVYYLSRKGLFISDEIMLELMLVH
ncbi:radical SAM family heme chaperone HemW [Prolixibacteraceae bacterium JC049]|nr:radical SAM family heme chaperone HemW [Prolixibacteraceae bacterium JC049]